MSIENGTELSVGKGERLGPNKSQLEPSVLEDRRKPTAGKKDFVEGLERRLEVGQRWFRRYRPGARFTY